MFFIHRAIFIFIPLGVPWGSNFGPCCKSEILTSARKIRINIVYVFFTHQTLPIFIPLVVPGGPNLDLCGKSVILTSVRKIRIKVVYDFVALRHVLFSLIAPSLCAPLWIFVTKVLPWRAQAKLI